MADKKKITMFIIFTNTAQLICAFIGIVCLAPLCTHVPHSQTTIEILDIVPSVVVASLIVSCYCYLLLLFSVFVDVVVVVERWHSVHTGVRTKLKTKCSPCTAPGMPQNMYRIKLWIPFQPCGIQDATAISAKELNVWREQFGNR